MVGDMQSSTSDIQNEAGAGGSARKPVTRVEILEATGHVFDNPPVSREDLLAEADAHDARPALVELLQHLPDEKFRQRSDLWSHLGEVPIDD